MVREIVSVSNVSCKWCLVTKVEHRTIVPPLTDVSQNRFYPILNVTQDNRLSEGGNAVCVLCPATSSTSAYVFVRTNISYLVNGIHSWYMKKNINMQFPNALCL